ncbi:unnamed protein product [Lampetra planeri]
MVRRWKWRGDEGRQGQRGGGRARDTGFDETESGTAAAVGEAPPNPRGALAESRGATSGARPAARRSDGEVGESR